MRAMGGCHCGAVRYEIDCPPIAHALCHCTDCRRHAGAPMVGWLMLPAGAFRMTKGVVAEYASSENGRRYFCLSCGAGIYYLNEVTLSGLVDVQSATLDDPDAAPPPVHIQTAERISWMHGADSLPAFERYPPLA